MDKHELLQNGRLNGATDWWCKCGLWTAFTPPPVDEDHWRQIEDQTRRDFREHSEGWLKSRGW